MHVNSSRQNYIPSLSPIQTASPPPPPLLQSPTTTTIITSNTNAKALHLWEKSSDKVDKIKHQTHHRYHLPFHYPPFHYHHVNHSKSKRATFHLFILPFPPLPLHTQLTSLRQSRDLERPTTFPETQWCSETYPQKPSLSKHEAWPKKWWREQRERKTDMSPLPHSCPNPFLLLFLPFAPFLLFPP